MVAGRGKLVAATGRRAWQHEKGKYARCDVWPIATAPSARSISTRLHTHFRATPRRAFWSAAAQSDNGRGPRARVSGLPRQRLQMSLPQTHLPRNEIAGERRAPARVDSQDDSLDVAAVARAPETSQGRALSARVGATVLPPLAATSAVCLTRPPPLSRSSAACSPAHLRRPMASLSAMPFRLFCPWTMPPTRRMTATLPSSAFSRGTPTLRGFRPA